MGSGRHGPSLHRLRVRAHGRSADALVRGAGRGIDRLVEHQAHKVLLLVRGDPIQLQLAWAHEVLFPLRSES